MAFIKTGDAITEPEEIDFKLKKFRFPILKAGENPPTGFKDPETGLVWNGKAWEKVEEIEFDGEEVDRENEITSTDPHP